MTKRFMSRPGYKTFQLSENNSGGSFWLNKADYEALLRAGWQLPEGWDKTERDRKPFTSDDDVPYGWRHGLYAQFESLEDAVRSFEKATGQDYEAEGCHCCGRPFYLWSDESCE